MNNYQHILGKLEAFIRKFYTKQLIKGVFLFLCLGLLFWLFILSFEYVLWLNQGWRLMLFLLFIGIEAFLLYRFIVVPLLYLFRVRKGMDNRAASKLVGKHFPEVDDRLLNLLELSESDQKSDLLLASIEQRAKTLGPVPFTEAVQVKESYRYAKYLLIPALIIGFIWITGDLVSFFNSHNRVVHYQMAFERPAPFSFKVLNESLDVLDNEPLTLRVTTTGEVRPERVSLVYNGETLVMMPSGEEFTYTLSPSDAESVFYLQSDQWTSRSYTVRSFQTPRLDEFSMKLVYPDYLKQSPETIVGSGNAVVPEGTKVTWQIKGKFIDALRLTTSDTIQNIQGSEGLFHFSKQVLSNFPYEISTSNEYVQEFERLGYHIDVVKDASPTIQVEQFMDSINPNQSYYTGVVSDDHGVAKLRLVCYPSDDKNALQKLFLESPNTNVHQFYYSFPSGLHLEEGKRYKLYFEVVDNDGVRGGKITKSKVFDASVYSDNELKNKELEFQNTTLSRMDQTLDKLKEQKETLDAINTRQKEERSISFEDKSQIRDFIAKQQQQEALMKKFSEDLNKSLAKDDSDSEMKKMLQERLERQELEAKKNAELLKELEKIAEKIDKEELQRRLEEMAKNQGKDTRNLEQILELTKRYYVTEKANQIGLELEKQAKRQDILSELKLGDDFSDKEQRKLNEEFKELEQEINELLKDNSNLQKPMDFDLDNRKTESVKQDQEGALEEINKQQGQEQADSNQPQSKKEDAISKKQKSAAQKMQEMSDALKQGSSNGGNSDSEDAEMLRQILDNLVTFSFKQESLFDKVQTADVDVSQFSRTVKDQQNLRRLFEHVDDSLFALSLRKAEISEFVNEQISEVYYNIDKSLESIADNQIYQGASYQQYVINATNALADFLANILDNLQQNMQPGQGNGQGSDFQLPDIIKGQQSIQEQMQGSGKDGKNPQEGKEGEGKQSGKESKDGNASGKNKEGNQGEQGNSGRTNGNGNGGEEMGLNEVYEIYKEQQFLRQQLEQQLENMIQNSDKDLTKKLIQQMEDFENDLLENGITNRTISKANTIQHQLMKLENAAMEQGERKERESNSSERNFTNPIITKPELLKDHSSDIEILNRQVLPLRQNFERKVKSYFNND